MGLLLVAEYVGLTYAMWRLLSWGKPERHVVLSWFLAFTLFLGLAGSGWLIDFNQGLLGS